MEPVQLQQSNNKRKLKTAQRPDTGAGAADAVRAEKILEINELFIALCSKKIKRQRC